MKAKMGFQRNTLMMHQSGQFFSGNGRIGVPGFQGSRLLNRDNYNGRMRVSAPLLKIVRTIDDDDSNTELQDNNASDDSASASDKLQSDLKSLRHKPNK